MSDFSRRADHAGGRPLIPGRIIQIRDTVRGKERQRTATVKRVGRYEYLVLPDGMKTPVWVSPENIQLGESEEYAREYFRPRKKRARVTDSTQELPL